jgi:hypothetical protein
VAYPSALTLAINGGPIILSDGDRLDSYQRLARWLENRLLLSELTPQGFAEAMRAGRGYGVFTLFGGPNGFAFFGRSWGSEVPMGASAKAPVQLTIQVPARPVQLDGAPFTPAQADTAQIQVRIVRGDPSGPTVIRQTTTFGETLTETVSAPGPYHVELWIRPLHLQAALGSKASLADPFFLWVISNPIRVGP